MGKLFCHIHVISSFWSPIWCLVLGLPQQTHRESAKGVTEQLITGDREHSEPRGHAARQSCGQGSQDGQRLQIWTRTLPNTGQEGVCIAQHDFPSLAPQVTLVLCSHGRENPQKGGTQRAARPRHEAGARPEGSERGEQNHHEPPHTRATRSRQRSASRSPR